MSSEHRFPEIGPPPPPKPREGMHPALKVFLWIIIGVPATLLAAALLLLGMCMLG